MRLTPFAGLVQLEPGDDLAVNNYQFYENAAIEDAMFQSFSTHKHDGSPAMDAFATNPTLAVHAASGSLSPSTTYWIGVTALDQYGGETIAAYASATTTAETTNPATGPTCSAFNDGTGDMTAGTYRYVFTKVSASGETTASPVTNVTIQTDGRVFIVPPSPGAQWRLYRSFGYADLSRVGTTLTASSFIDDGSTSVFYDQQPPETNTTNGTSSITVTRPTLPASAVAWRVYAGLDSSLASPSLWTFDEFSQTDIPTASSSILFSDVTELTNGSPPSVSRTIPGAAQLEAQHVLYAGAGSILASGNVELALDTLSASSMTLGASGEAQMRGDVILKAGSGMTITSSAQVITFTSTGGGSNTTFAASGQTPINGAVTLVGASGIVLSQNNAASSITIYGTTVSKAGDPKIYGDVQFVAGTGINITQTGSSITIEDSGVAAASAGVNSIKVLGGAQLQGNLILYAGSGITIIEEPAVGSGVTINASAQVFRTVHTFAVAGEIAVPVGDTDFIPPFFISKGSRQSVKIIKVRHKLNGGTAASAKLQKNGSDITGFDGPMNVTTTAATTSADSGNLAEDDRINLVVTGVSGTPMNMTATVVIEHTVLPS